jgi:transcriptional regulator with XRE-family HTH domain
MATLKELRISRLWSQHELARRAGVGVGTVINIETGQRSPRLLTMRRIAEALEVAWEEVDEFRAAVEGLAEKVAA